MSVTLSAAAIAAIAAGLKTGAGIVQAQDIYGKTERERLEELEAAGLTVEAEEGLRALSGELLDPIETAAAQEEEERRKALTPLAAQGMFGAVARATQGSEERMARALEIPQMKLIEERRRREIQEEEEIQHLEDLKAEKRRAIATSVLQGAAETGAAAMEYQKFQAQMEFQEKELERYAARWQTKHATSKVSADDLQEAYDAIHGEGAFNAALKGQVDAQSYLMGPGVESVTPMGDFPVTGSDPASALG